MSTPAECSPTEEFDVANTSEGIWLAPDFDPFRLTRRLQQQLGSAGGAIDQTLLYWEHTSALDWHAIATQREYQAGQSGTHYQWIAREIGYYLEDTFGPGKKSLEVIALGPGHAESEIRLVQELLETAGVRHVHLDLIDISQPLLAFACNHVDQAFEDDPRVSYGAIQGDFYNIRQYKQLLRRASQRPCLVIMLGSTLATIHNEPLFVQNSLGGFKPYDLLLIEAPTVYAPIGAPEELQKIDPRLTGTLPPPVERAYRKFLQGPLLRFYQNQPRGIETASILDFAGCSVSKSYAVEFQTKVEFADRTKKEFSMMRFTRYTKEEFIHMCYAKGWSPVCNWDFGSQNERCAYLFWKRA